VEKVPFRGGPVVALDQKGRVTVPARWREQLQSAGVERLWITKHPDGCLGLYPPAVFAQIESTVLGLTSEDEAWKRLISGNAEEVEIDTTSRVLVPPDLRRWAGLEKDIKFMGVGTHFELWDLARYEVHEQQAIARGRPEALRALKLA
jgi:MraZ protein